MGVSKVGMSPRNWGKKMGDKSELVGVGLGWEIQRKVRAASHRIWSCFYTQTGVLGWAVF